MKYIPIIIILVLILAIIIAVYCGVRYLKRKTQEISLSLLGTANLTKGAEQLKQEYAATPKSVSGMTRLLLPKLVKDFPEFQYDEMKERAENVLTSYLRAVTEKKPELLTEGNTELKQQLANHIRELSAQNLQEHFDQIKIHRTELNQYRKTDGRCIVTFQSAIECFHYVESPSGIQEGSDSYKYQTKFNTDVIYIQDRNVVEKNTDHALGVKCPNCGAPLSSLGAKVCEYCDTPIVAINIHAWSFSDVKEMN